MNELLKIRKKGREHIGGVTAEGLILFRNKETLFSPYVSYNTLKGPVALGVNGKGHFVVKFNNQYYKYNFSADAIRKYSEIIDDN